MSNFAFLKTEWPELAESSSRAEALTLPDPRAACFYARRTLELAVEWLYEHDDSFKEPYETTLSARLYEPTFRENLPNELFIKATLIKDLGNRAVHRRVPVSQNDSLQATKELFHFLYWLSRTYTRNSPSVYAGLAFNARSLPSGSTVPPQTMVQLQKLEAELKQRDLTVAEQAKKLAETHAEIARLKKEIAEAKARNKTVPDQHDYSEAETRDYFIDLLLKEAGWTLNKKNDLEFPVSGMPNNSGNGFVDYVLWGDDGLPLALVEAKKTKKDPEIGQHQAKLYADCLEKQFGRRPVIFYSNGYNTWLWDDHRYPPRRVQGFYKKDELELLIQRRTSRKALAKAPVNKAIVDRHYQEEAIRSICEDFEGNHRRALVVMATGSGKTRTIVSLCELLQQCNWAKRILFLADRNALVKQAVNAFKKFLPQSNPVNLVTEKESTGNRVFVSTYPTMMGLIDENNDDGRRFGPGHFDLVIVDEAHRSIYQKYRAIFQYFDSLLVGLTATPRDEVDKNTYSLFELETGVPTFAYELGQAVDDGFLVPPQPISVPLKFQRQGIRYDDLPEEEKAQWDELEWNEEGDVPDQVDAAALNHWLFNEDTVDKVLQHLMLNGLKVAGGDRLGKTIIFAKNHRHAAFIQERFDKNYPHLKGHFARVIDNYEPYAQDLLDNFSIPQNDPHIAISVDMLDTGVDVPEAVNLVFFKLVRSRTKFFQMIGRGTRLSPDLFGPGQHKQFFYIFDFCQNLEFFNQNPKGIEAPAQQSLGKKLFLRRLELVGRLDQSLILEEAAVANLRHELVSILHREVASMNIHNFIVRPHRQHVETFQKLDRWRELSPEDHSTLAHHLAGMPSELDPEDETVKQFDLLMLNGQLALLEGNSAFDRLRQTVRSIAAQLESKANIPAVAEQLPLIQEIQTDEFWTDITLPLLENVRKRLRNLVRFIDKTKQNTLVTNFEDEIGPGTVMHIAGFGESELKQYRKKILYFIKAHEDHISIRKLRLNEPITETDLKELDQLLFEIGGLSRDAFEKLNPEHETLGAFIRKLVGLDRDAAKKAFANYLNEKALTANQIRFIELIIDYLTTNGVMDPALLYEPPFTDMNPDGPDGIFGPDAPHIVEILDLIKRNAAAA